MFPHIFDKFVNSANKLTNQYQIRRFHRPPISPTNSPSQIKYGSGGEPVALAEGDASGSRLNRFHR
ncbi:MAG: hypothetical protein RR808_06315, partial [Akkermansia sp.]